MDIKVTMPDLSTTGEEVTVLKWRAEVGQPILRGQPLFEVETDKATMDIESVESGILKTQIAEPGATVAVGEVVAIIEIDSPANKTLDRKPDPDLNQSLLATHIPAERLRDHDLDFLLSLYEQMVRIREFEEGVKYLFLKGSMPGTIHQCQGQEATAVGVCAALGDDDFITSTFRGHGHALAKGLTMEEMLCELYGAKSGCCQGKGGSMHMGNPAKGMIPAIAIVGGGIPLASGMALAFKMQGTSQVVACFFGDGATSEGAFHEGITLAAIWNLPAIFVCENNLYGASTRVDKITRLEKLSDHASAYGIRGETLDGNDVLTVYEATTQAVQECRSGAGPVLLEMLTYRRTGHSRRDACHYQSKEEKELWFSRDPIEMFGNALIQRDSVDAQSLENIRDRIVEEFAQLVEVAKNQPEPDLSELTTDVFT